MKKVCCIRNGEKDARLVDFESLKRGDTFFAGGVCFTVGEDAHYSGDSSYNGYLLYDTNGYSWFPEELDTKLPEELDSKVSEDTVLHVVHKTRGGLGLYLDISGTVSREGLSFKEGTSLEEAVRVFRESFGLDGKPLTLLHSNEWGDGPNPVRPVTQA